MTRPRIGLALGSGSARGWSHIGIIDSLIEAGIEPDIVCGTSIGALVGAAYVAGQLAELRQWAAAVTWREIVGLMDFRLSSGGLIEGKLVVDFMRGLGIAKSIESYAKLYAAVATDLTTGREIWLQSARSTRRCVRRSRCPESSARPGLTTNGFWTAALPIRSRSRSAVRLGQR
jgi:NTE family protein